MWKHVNGRILILGTVRTRHSMPLPISEHVPHREIIANDVDPLLCLVGYR